MPNYYFLLTDIQKTLDAILGELKSINEKLDGEKQND